MGVPFLLAQTPRAGEMNHKFVASPGAGLTDDAAAELVHRAKNALGSGMSSHGPDFVAVVGEPVFQKHGDRQGEEVLILGGIDTATLNVTTVLQSLRSSLPELKAVAEEIAASPGLLAEHPALWIWLEEALAAGQETPPTGRDSTPRQTDPCQTGDAPSTGRDSARGPRPRRIGIKIGLAALALAVVVGVAYAVWPRSTPPSTDPTVVPIDPSRSEPTADELAAALGLTGNAAALEEIGLRIKDPGTTRELIDQAKADEIRPYHLLSDPASTLPVLLPVHPPVPKDRVLEFRHYLHQWRSHLATLRTAVQNCGLHKAESMELAKLPTLALLAELGRDAAPYASLAPVPAPPTLPWLDTSDRDTANALGALFSSTAGTKFAADRLGLKKQPGLREKLSAVHDQVDTWHSKYRNEERDMWGKDGTDRLEKVTGELRALSDAIGKKTLPRPPWPTPVVPKPHHNHREFNMRSVPRGKVLVTVAISVLGGIGFVGWKAGWFAGIGQTRHPGNQKDDGKKQPDPPASPRDAFRAAVGAGDEDRKKKADAELQYLKVDDALLPALTADLGREGGIDPYLILGRDRGVLIDLIPTGERIPKASGVEVREYLLKWRKHLADMRKVARAANLQELDAKKLEPHLTLALLAHLGSGVTAFKALDADPPEMAPVLPWLGPAEREAAEALRELFVGSEPGKAFADGRLGLTKPELKELLVTLHDKDKAAAIDKALVGELGNAAHEKLVPDRAALESLDTAVSKLTLALRKSELPKSLAPQKKP